MNALAGQHPAPAQSSARWLAVTKAIDRTIDLTLQMCLRIAGIGLAASALYSFGFVIVHLFQGPASRSQLSTVGYVRLVLWCLFCLTAACLLIQFAVRNVPEIVRTGGAHWFSRWTILGLLQSTLLVAFISCALEVAWWITSAIGAVVVPTVFRHDDSPFDWGGVVMPMIILAIPACVFASRYTWKLERHWFPERESHPLFGRWLEWKRRHTDPHSLSERALDA